MNQYDVDKAYVSPYDQLFYKFDATHPKSESQLKEIKKYKRIFALRDTQEQTEDTKEIWSDF